MWNWVPSPCCRRSFPSLKITVAPLAVAAFTEKMSCGNEGIYNARQSRVEASPSAVNQAHLRDPVAPCAIRQLHTVCLSLEPVVGLLELCYIRDDMRSRSRVHHQTFSIDTVPWLDLARPECRSVLLASSETRRASSRRRLRLQVASRCVVLLHWLHHCFR